MFVALTALYKPLLSVKHVIWSLSICRSISSMNFASKTMIEAASTNENVSAANVDLTNFFILFDVHIN